jgi:iron complex outermembrane receptor protein
MNTGDIDGFYPGLGMYVQDALEPQPSKDTMFAPSITVKDALAAGELTSVTSYFFRRNDHETDGTYFNSDFFQYLADTSPDLGACQCGVAFTTLGSPSYSTERTQVFTEEVRFSSDLPKQGDLPFSYIAGVFISDRRTQTSEYDFIPGVRQLFETLYGEPPQDTSFADPLTGDLVGYNVGRESQKQYALYGELTYYPTDGLKITAGLRGAHAQTGFNFVTGGYFAQGIAPQTTESGSSNAATPKLAASYDVTQNITAYATTSEGYRIGGYIVPIDLTTGLCPGSLAAFGITNPKFSYEPDRLWNYELGGKTNWLDNHLTVNLDVYYIDWKDVQQTFALSCGTQYTANFGDAASYGSELEILAKPLQGWTVGLNAGTTHATLTDVVPNVGATNGQHLLNTPAWTASLNTEYDWLLGSLQPFIRADYSLIGPAHGSYNVDDAAYNYPRYAITNGSAGINRGNFSASVYVKNMFNDQTIIQRISEELLEQAYVPRPRTVGLQVSAKF